MNRTVLALSSFLFVMSTYAASFDCGKASTQVEKLICNIPALSALDGELDSSYRNAIDKTRLGDNGQVVAAQRKWLRQVRNMCSNEQCLGSVYTARIRELKVIYPFLGTYHGSLTRCSGDVFVFTLEGITWGNCKNISYDITESDVNHIVLMPHTSPSCDAPESVNISRAIPVEKKTLKPVKGFGNVNINECGYGPEYSPEQLIMIQSGTY